MTDKHFSLAKDRINFVLLEGIHDRASEYIRKAGYNSIQARSEALDDASCSTRLARRIFLAFVREPA
jgi:D-3-phosphoglycerate dehydrogenase / 2-oxoglutarate reductase